ncbi:tetratricopeptide repeat protein [Limibaculum sp. M0105]|uniref:Tetratricopeptide repeat protein n=1 Tax=Thermohalobaculum xanthum TaxID=2753746 RepID=A0A8J7M8B6_9RHOB|nr:tetratricopeptide repeat protein [Thermohalobaculum xanthum]MBK0400436.1 tetratricopeptide repeat protein [Thermohalobaculum xanthum]
MEDRGADDALASAERAVEDAPGDPGALLALAKLLRERGDFDASLAAFDEAARRAMTLGPPGDGTVRAEAIFGRGLVLSEQERWPDALAAFEQTATLVTPGASLAAALCQAYCLAGKLDEALPWRRRTLALRDAAARCAPSDRVASARPGAFDPGARKRNIVAYCLFGTDRYYHECAVTIARTTPASFPEFTARFYCAADVPRAVLEALRAARAQVVIADEGETHAGSAFSGTLWRFLAFDDPGVDVVLCRDVDSPILPRERAAIDLWLTRDEPFYCLRDHPVHAELLLAGMWGGFTRVLPPLTETALRHSHRDATKFADQRFLRSWVWPRIKHALLQIDSFASLEGSIDFPPTFRKVGRQHVGMSWTRKQILGA